MTDFHKSGYGRTFFEHQLPTLLRELAALNNNLVKLAKLLADDVQRQIDDEEQK